MRRPIGPPMPELQHHLPIARDTESIAWHRRTERIAAHPLESVAVPGRYHQAGMQIEPVRPRLTRPGLGGGLHSLGRFPETPDASRRDAAP